MKNISLYLCAFFTLTLYPLFSGLAHAEQLVYGAGPSTEVVKLFFNEFGKLPVSEDIKFEIPSQSIKHAGGVNSSTHYLFGRTGRPLNDKEKKINKAEILLGQVPIVAAVGSGVNINSFDLGQLKKIVTGEVTNWKEIGGPNKEIMNVGREDNEALYSILKKKYPFYRTAKFSKYFVKDHQVVDYLKSPSGSYAIAFGAECHFKGIDNVTILKIDNFSAGQKLGLVYDLSNKNHPLVKAAEIYAKSHEWQKIVVENGFLPVN